MTLMWNLYTVRLKYPQKIRICEPERPTNRTHVWNIKYPIKRAYLDGWREEEEEEEEGRTLEVAVEPFGLPGADVARPPPRVGVARRPLQHPPPESSSAGLAAPPGPKCPSHRLCQYNTRLNLSMHGLLPSLLLIITISVAYSTRSKCRTQTGRSTMSITYICCGIYVIPWRKMKQNTAAAAAADRETSRGRTQWRQRRRRRAGEYSTFNLVLPGMPVHSWKQKNRSEQ